jgi:hypothetical protein
MLCLLWKLVMGFLSWNVSAVIYLHLFVLPVVVGKSIVISCPIFLSGNFNIRFPPLRSNYFFQLNTPSLHKR